MILDCVGETEGVKVGSADVDKVYWLESDGTLLCNGIDDSVKEDVTVILPQGDGVVVDVMNAEAVTVEDTELVPDAVLVGNDVEVVLTDAVSVPVELVDKVASEVADTDDESTLERETAVDGEKTPVSVAIKVAKEDAVADDENNDDAVVLTDNVNVPVELVDKVASEVVETDDDSTFERETAVDGETTPDSVAIKVTRDEADDEVVEDEVALDVKDAVAEEVALLVD